jgi:hypothetical protein
MCSSPLQCSSQFSSRTDLSNKPSFVQFEAKEPKLYLKKRFYLGKGPSQGQIPGLLGHGSEISEMKWNEIAEMTEKSLADGRTTALNQ